MGENVGNYQLRSLDGHNYQQILGAGTLGSDEEGANLTALARSSLTCEALLKTSLNIGTTLVQKNPRGIDKEENDLSGVRTMCTVSSDAQFHSSSAGNVLNEYH
jgi:hypothetical protein